MKKARILHPMQTRKKPDVDVLKDILEAAKLAYPKNEFVHSLAFQYEERGGLSKRQLEGLFKKWQKIKDLAPGKLATLEAMILKKPSKTKAAPPPPPKPMFTADEDSIHKVTAILDRYPQHKRVLVFQQMLERNQPLSPSDKTELDKFHKLLVK